MIEDMFDLLAHPFDPDKVHWRVGNTNVNKQTGQPPEGKAAQGLALAYLDARDVMDRLDIVVGPAGWQCRYSHANGKTVCDLAIKVDGEWIWKADGAGDSDVEAEKGALSDAFKRAAVRWGVGRYLYALGNTWVKLEPQGRSWIIAKDEYSRLRKVLADFTGIPRKHSAAAKRDQDAEYWFSQFKEAQDMEQLGAVGRALKVAKPNIPHAFHDALADAYLIRREELLAQLVHA